MTKLCVFTVGLLYCGCALGADAAVYGYQTSPVEGIYALEKDCTVLLWKDGGHDSRNFAPMTSGWVVDNKLCGYSSNTSYACYMEFDWASGVVLTSVDMPPADCPAIATLSEAEGLVYGYQAAGQECKFFTAPITNPADITLVSTTAIEDFCLGLTYNPCEEYVVGIRRDGTLVKVNADGTQESLMDTYYTVSPDSDCAALTFSADENCYYWNPTSADADAELLVIDWFERYAAKLESFPATHFNFLLTACPPEQPQALQIALDKTEVEMIEGETVTVTATIIPDTAVDKSIAWRCSDEAVATVDDGVVMALKAGEATITASTSNGLEAHCLIRVVEKEPEVILISEIIINPQSIEALPGSEVQLAVTVLPADATNAQLEWSSTDESVAVVNQHGLVTIRSVGSAVINVLAKDGSGVRAECSVDGLAGIEELIIRQGCANIYDINGILMKSHAGRHDLNNLSPGSYIIKIGDHAYKLLKQ